MATEATATRKKPSSAEIEAQMREENAKAKALFTDKFEGASIRLKTVLHNRAVIRSFRRSYNISMRNWYIATTVTRSALGDATLASQSETRMLKKITEVSSAFKNKVAQCDAIAKDGGVDFSLIGHDHQFEDDTRIVGPVAMQLRELYLLCDRFLDLTSALYAYGQIDSTQASTNQHDVKRKLDGVITSIRNTRRLALNAVNEAGKARSGFKKVVIDGPNAGEEKGTGESPSPSTEVAVGNVTPIAGEAANDAENGAANDATAPSAPTKKATKAAAAA